MKLAILGSGTASREPPAIWRQWLGSSPTTQIELINPRFVTFAFSAYERLLVDLGYVDAAQQAVRAGCDAVIINSFADYGIEATRAAVQVPVIGAGETALQVASANGQRPFSIVTVWPRSMAFLYEERLRATRLENLCRGLHHLSNEDELTRLGDPAGVMARMSRQETAVIDRVAALCKTAVAHDGCEAIVLGCTCMAPIAAQLAERLAIPVIEGSQAAIGRAQSITPRAEVATLRSTVEHNEIPQLIDAWLRMNPSNPLATGTDCPICLDSTEND